MANAQKFIRIRNADGKLMPTWQEVAYIYNEAQKIKNDELLSQWQKEEKIRNVINLVLEFGDLIPVVGQFIDLAGKMLAAGRIGRPDSAPPGVCALPLTLAGTPHSVRQFYIGIAESIFGSKIIDMRTADLLVVSNANSNIIGVTDGDVSWLFPGAIEALGKAGWPGAGFMDDLPAMRFEQSQHGDAGQPAMPDEVFPPEEVRHSWDEPPKPGEVFPPEEVRHSWDEPPGPDEVFTERTGGEQSVFPPPDMTPPPGPADTDLPEPYEPPPDWRR